MRRPTYPRILLVAVSAGALALLTASAPLGASTARPAPLPRHLWVLELDGKGAVGAGTLRRYRAQGFNAVVTHASRLSARRTASVRRGAAGARLLHLRSRKAKGGACAAAKRQRLHCVLLAPSSAAARRLARSGAAQLVVVRLSNLNGLRALRGRARGRILALVPLDGKTFNLRAWVDAAASSASDRRLDLGVSARGARRALAAQRFGAVLRALNDGGRVANPPSPPPPTPPAPPPPPPPPPAPPLTEANMWIDTNGGFCSRQATVVPYDDAQACGSFAAAYGAASSGDLVGVRPGTYPPQFFAGGAGGTQPDGSKTLTFRGQPGAVIRQLHVSSPNLTFDGFAVNAGGAKLGGGDGAVLELGDADYVTFKNGTVGNVIDQKGAIIDGHHMTIDNVVFHDVIHQSPGVHNECLFAMIPDYLVMKNSTFQNCATMDVNMNWPDYWQPQPPAYGHVTLENNVFGHSVDGSGWHYYGFLLGGTGPNAGAPACAQGQKAASYLVGWVVRYNTFENTALFDGCATQSRWVGNLGVWDCVQGMTYSRNVGKACGATDLAVSNSALYRWRNPAAWDFHLTAGSVAIDRGDAADHPGRDRDGKARTGVPDAGAYEY